VAVTNQQKIAPSQRWITLPPGLPPFTLGWGAIKWAMKYLHQPDGDAAGARWKFTNSQARFLLWWYAVDESASWEFSHGMRRLPKGAGKSPFAAVMALCEMCAPVRFSHWGVDNHGDKMPVGKPVGMPLVQIAATAENQGLINTMRMVRALIATPEDPSSKSKKSRIVHDYGLDVGKTLIYKPGGGQLHVITNSANATEGALTTFGICDQTELWVKSNGGIDLFEVMDRNTAKSKSRLVQTSNAWQPGAGSVAQTTHDAWIAEQEGRTRGRARTLMDVRMAPPDTDTGSRESLLRGVEVAYGDSYWADPEDIVDRHIFDLKTPLDVSLRFYLNWPRAAEDAWVTQQEFDRWANPDVELDDGDEITLGFDGSRTNDATSLIGCRIRDGFVFDLGTWETEPLPGGGRTIVPVDEVDAAVARAFDRWNPVAFFADVREWESFSKIEWPRLYAERLEVMSVPGGRDPQPIAWDMRTHVSEFTAAAEMVNEEIIGESPAFYHDGSAVLSRHVANARRRPNRFGISIAKESHDSPNKIDACVAMIIARHARRLYLSNARTAKKKVRTGRVWSYS